MSDDELVAAVRDWAEQLEAALRLDGSVLDLDAVLDVAGLAARAVVRPAAPVTTYLLGYAVGRATAGGAPSGPAFAEAIAAVRALTDERRPGSTDERRPEGTDVRRPADESPA